MVECLKETVALPTIFSPPTWTSRRTYYNHNTQASYSFLIDGHRRRCGLSLSMSLHALVGKMDFSSIIMFLRSRRQQTRVISCSPGNFSVNECLSVWGVSVPARNTRLMLATGAILPATFSMHIDARPRPLHTKCFRGTCMRN